MAKSYNPESSLTAWFDRGKDRCSPSQAEYAAAGLLALEEYGRNPGGRKQVVVGSVEYFFGGKKPENAFLIG